MRCRRLPPSVAMLRSCCEAARQSDSESAGYSRTSCGSAATSLIRARAPKTSSLAGGVDAVQLRQRVDIDELAGVSISSFIRS